VGNGPWRICPSTSKSCWRSSSAQRLTLSSSDALARFGAPPNVVRAVLTMKPSEVVFLGQPPLRIDLLRTIDGLSTEEVFARAVHTELDGLALRVIALDDLITNKRASGRPQDLEDARFLDRVRASRGE
jgi:hypothetical protein